MPKTIYDMEYRDLVAGLRRARKANGLRQQDVGRELGVDRTWVSKIERSEIRLDVMQLVRLAKLYQLDVHDLVDALDP
jgi:transcriptional regulator with XRE-family HTH domain